MIQVKLTCVFFAQMMNRIPYSICMVECNIVSLLLHSTIEYFGQKYMVFSFGF